MLFPEALVNDDDDYVEEVRGYLYPKLHPYLVKFTPAYGVGQMTQKEYVGAVKENEETVESELVDLGFVRNPIACYKSLQDGRESEGSWVLLPERDDHGVLERDDQQLHVTLFQRKAGAPGRALYAHREFDWRDRPMAHLRGKALSRQDGRSMTRELLNEYSFLQLK